MNTEYIKDYKYKELKQYVLAYLLVAIASVGLYTKVSVGPSNLLSSFLNMVSIDVLVGAICSLVFVFNELWSDKSKAKIVYCDLPSNTVFSDIASGNIDETGFDLIKAQETYAYLSNATAEQQTAQWNKLLKKSRDAKQGNVIEAERLQLMTRDICMSTVSLFIMNSAALAVLMVVFANKWIPIRVFAIPLAYLIVMFFVTRVAARNRAKRLVALVIKNDLQ